MVELVVVVWCVDLARRQLDLGDKKHFVHLDSGRLTIKYTSYNHRVIARIKKTHGVPVFSEQFQVSLSHGSWSAVTPVKITVQD